MASISLSPLQIKLDTDNPRFLDVRINEAEAISYLLKYSDVIPLAKSIVANGGLFVGERIVVTKNSDDSYTVLEGNRRTCACKLLLSRDLIPSNYNGAFPVINQQTNAAISNIEVDIVNSREEVASFLANRHVESAMLWSPLAKMKFYVSRFDAGETVQSIAAVMHTRVGDVSNGIKRYKLISYALNLPCWTQQEKEAYLNIFDIEVDKFLRIFRTKGASQALGIIYNDSFDPSSSLGNEIFDQIVEQVMRCAFITEEVNTRTANWRDVPGLLAIIGMDSDDSSQDSQDATESEEENEEENEESSSGFQQNASEQEASDTQPNTDSTQNSSQHEAYSEQNQSGTTSRPARPTYSRATLIPLSCQLNIQNPKLHNLYSDLQRINLHSFTNSVAITFRVFFELIVEEHLTNKNISVNRNDNLPVKFGHLLNYLEQAGLLDQRDAIALRQLTSRDPNNPTILSILNFHDYVHRLDYQPTPRDLMTIWDNLQRLMLIVCQ